MTEELYNENLRSIERNHAGHFMLPTFRQGFSVLNVIYMKYFLTQVKKKPTKIQIAKLKKKLNPVYQEKRKLYNKRAKLSNAMIASETVEEAADLSDQILSVTSEIAIREKAIRRSLSENTLILPGDLAQFDVKVDDAMTKFEIAKKLKSTREMLSRLRKKMKSDKSDKLKLRKLALETKKTEYERRLRDY